MYIHIHAYMYDYICMIGIRRHYVLYIGCLHIGNHLAWLFASFEASIHDQNVQSTPEEAQLAQLGK